MWPSAVRKGQKIDVKWRYWVRHVMRSRYQQGKLAALECIFESSARMCFFVGCFLAIIFPIFFFGYFRLHPGKYLLISADLWLICGYFMLFFCYFFLIFGYLFLIFGFFFLIFVYFMLFFGYFMLFFVYVMLIRGCFFLIFGYFMLIYGYFFLICG